MIRSWGLDLLDLVLPSGCVACGVWIPGGGSLVCAVCRSRLREAPWPRCPRCHHPRGTGRADANDCLECRWWPAELSAARYAFVLDAPATDLVHALKYEGWRELAGFMAAAMARSATAAHGATAAAPAVARVGPRPRPVVVPIPTTADRLASRGYNQAALLAGHLAAALDAPIAEVLRRRPGRVSQTSLSPAERRENVRGAFVATAGGADAVRGRDVTLVDDVLTTGATATEAARVLAAAGARSVELVAFARALPGRARRVA